MSTDEQIYQKILKAIVEHQLPLGARLPEDRLSEAFGVSRTGIRKVLQRLSLEHFVVITRNKGAQVNYPSEDEALEVLDSRILIEPQLIASLQAHWNKELSEYFRDLVDDEHQAKRDGDLTSHIQATARFHYELAKVAGNSIIAAFIEQLCYRSSLVIAAYGTPSRGVCDCSEHEQLLDLLDRNEPEQAYEWMTDHLKTIKQSLVLESHKEQNIDFHRLFSG